MQPNQQNPYGQPTPPPSPTGYAGSNVPDFLQLDPIPEPKVPRSRKKIITAILIFLTVMGLVGYSWWVKTEPDRVLYTALDKIMAAEAVEVRVTVKYKGVPRGTLAVQTSFSSGLKKVSGRASYDFESLSRNGEAEGRLKGDLVVSDSTSYFSRITSLPQGVTDIKKDVWYRWAINGSGVSGLYDPLDLRRYAFSSVLDSVLMGGFDDEMRENIINLIRTNKVYRVESIEKTMQGAKDAIRLSVVFDGIKLLKIGTDIKEALELDYNPIPARSVDNIKANFWIDDVTQQIIKVESSGVVADLPYIHEAVIAYPDQIDIRAIEGATEIKPRG